MTYWQRPKFWLILIAMEIVAFLLSACFTGGIGLICAIFSSSHHLPSGRFIDVIGGLIDLYLAYDAFRLARSIARSWPQRQLRGFSVIFKEPD